MARRSAPAFQEPNPADPEVLTQSLKEFAVIMLDPKGVIVRWSSGAEKIFGYTEEEIRGRHFSVIFTEEDQGKGRPEQELKAAAATSEQTAVDERWHVRKDGSVAWLSGTVCPIHNEAGELTGFSKVARDITSQKLAELQKEALLKRERAARERAEREWRRLEEIADRIPANIGLVRLPEGVYAFANRMLHEVLGGRTIIGRSVREVHPEAGPVLDLYDRAVRTGETQTGTDSLIRIDSGHGIEDRYFDITFQPMRGNGLPYDAVLIFSVEVTGRVMARALAASRAHSIEEQASLLDLAQDAVMTMTMDGTIEFWNRGAEQMYGWSKEEALGRNVHELLAAESPVPPERIKEIMISEGQWTGELTHYTRDGSKILASTIWVLRRHDGQARGWLEVSRDITERKRLETHLREAQKMESLGVLAGGIAHDFNNLLVGILGNISLVKEMLDPGSPLIPLLEDAEGASERAATLTRQMLAYAGKGDVFVTPVDLSGVVRDALVLARGSIPPTARIQLELKERLPCVQADALQLQQVPANLILNAAEALDGKGGVITIRTGVENVAGEAPDVTYAVGSPVAGRYVFLEVEDTGAGIDPAVRPNIFDPFYTTKFIGRGLGLAAVAGIVRTLHGAIRVRSEPGRGTCFEVLFPAAK